MSFVTSGQISVEFRESSDGSGEISYTKRRHYKIRSLCVTQLRNAYSREGWCLSDLGHYRCGQGGEQGVVAGGWGLGVGGSGFGAVVGVTR